MFKNIIKTKYYYIKINIVVNVYIYTYYNGYN